MTLCVTRHPPAPSPWPDVNSEQQVGGITLTLPSPSPCRLCLVPQPPLKGSVSGVSHPWPGTVPGLH